MPVPAVVGAVMAVDTVADAGYWVQTGVDMAFPEVRKSCEEHGENVVSRGLHDVLKGIDNVCADMNKGREDIGGKIHDAAASIPLIGPLAGGIVDAAGFAVDTVTGTVSNFGQGVGRGAVCISNVVGGVTAKAKYVDCDDITALDEYTDEEMANMSQSEIMRHEGVFGYAAHHVMNFFSPVMDSVGDVSSDVKNFFSGEQPQSDDAEVESGTMTAPDESSPVWYVDLYNAYTGGAVSEEELTTISAGIASGAIDTNALDSEVAAVGGSGSVAPWSDIASLTDKYFADNGLTSVDVLDTLETVDAVQAQDGMTVETDKETSVNNDVDYVPDSGVVYKDSGMTIEMV